MGSPLYIAVDPGAQGKGGIAYAFTQPTLLYPEVSPSGSYKMPDTTRDIAYALNHHVQQASDIHIWLEKVGEIRPGKGLGSQGKFAMHCGELRGILAAISLTHEHIRRVAVEYVLPSFWMRKLGGVPKGGEPAQVRTRKNYIKAKMQERWPGHPVTLATADALAMLAVMFDKERPGGLV